MRFLNGLALLVFCSVLNLRTEQQQQEYTSRYAVLAAAALYVRNEGQNKKTLKGDPMKTRNLITFNGGFKVTRFNEAQDGKKAYADVTMIDSYEKDGVEKKTVAYFKAFGKTAERLNKHEKGAMMIEGHLGSSEFEGQTSTFNVIDSIITIYPKKEK